MEVEVEKKEQAKEEEEKTQWSLFFLARKRPLQLHQLIHHYHSPVTLVAILKKMAPEKARPATKGQLEVSFLSKRGGDGGGW